MRRLIPLLTLIVSAPALAACADAPFRSEHGWTEERVLRYTWFEPRTVIAEPAYCYRTLAQPDCYRRAQPREATRIVGYIGPDPF